MIRYTDNHIPHSVRFWSFLIAFISFVCCSSIVLHHILSSRGRRRSINYHFIILILFNNLIYELINVPLFLNYYRLDAVVPATPSLCLMWMFIDEALYTVSTITVAWASIERHILIFHDRWLATSTRRFFIHYVPMTLLALYVVLFHCVVILFPPCPNEYDYTKEICGRPLCFHNLAATGTGDAIAHNLIPALTIVIFSIGLLVRVLLQNKRMRQVIRWRKHRKMAIQLLSVSFLYLLLYVPRACIELVEFCCLEEYLNDYVDEYSRFFADYVIFLLPFAYLGSLMKTSWRCRPRHLFPFMYRTTRLVHPTTLRATLFTQTQTNIAESTTRS